MTKCIIKILVWTVLVLVLYLCFSPQLIQDFTQMGLNYRMASGNTPASEPALDISLHLISDVNFVDPINSQKCTPQQYVFYSKICKTGSSTITTMIYRWGMRHNLTMVPVKATPFDKSITSKLLVPPDGSLRLRQYNYFAEHYIFNETEADRVMHLNTDYIVSLRFPLNHIRSQFKHAKLGNDNDPDPVKTFLRKYPNVSSVMIATTKNRMSRTLGLNPSYIGDSPQDLVKQQALFDDIITRFDVVLITEYMAESLVVLRRKLCWSMEDIMHLPQRVRHYEHKGATLPWELQQKHRLYSSSDYRLYEYYSEKLFRYIAEEGAFIWGEINMFKMMLGELHDFCDPIYQRMANNTKVIYDLAEEKENINFDPRPYGKPFTISGFDCAVMKLVNNRHREMLLTYQNPWICKSGAKQPRKNNCDQVHSIHGLSLQKMSHKSIYLYLNQDDTM